MVGSLPKRIPSQALHHIRPGYPGTGEPRAEIDDEVGTRPKPASGWAWGICWLMFASTVLNYMDRQSMALVGPQIRQEYGLSNADFGKVLMAFALTYAVFQLAAGYLVD